MTNINALAGLARARAKATNVPGTCLGTVYAAYGSVQSIGPHAGQYPIAYNGWLYSQDQHSGDFNAPAGVPVYFGPSPTRRDKNKNAGDVGISIGGGYAFFTDAAGAGRTGIMSLAARAIQTQRPYMGWTGDFLGHHLVNIGAVTAPAGSSGSSVSLGFDQNVKNRQMAINAILHLGLEEDGRLGAKTRAGIKALQKVIGAYPDGAWGSKTETAYANYVHAHAPKSAPASSLVLARGSKGPAVEQLQRTLNAKYPLYSKLATDGDFGPGTEKAVREFQRRAGLVVDGIAGFNTLHALGLA